MKRFTLGMTLVLAAAAAWAQQTEATVAPQDATAEVANGTVTVVGQRPGPGLWKVSKGDNVMWVFGTYGPLPKDMQWRSHQVEATIAQSQEYLPPPSGGTHVGFLKGLTLLPHVVGLKKNPDGAALKDVLPPEVYARWSVLKVKYIGTNDGIEYERPLFAAQTLLRAGLAQAGLNNGAGVDKKIAELVKKHNVKVTRVHINIDAEDPAKLMKDFKKSPMDDVACFAETLGRVESDIDAMRERANAWSRGTLSAIEKLSFSDREATCSKAMRDSAAFKSVLALRGLEARMKDGWFMAAEKALATNKTTFAVLRMQEILKPDGYLAGLEAKGYTVERPE